MEDWTNIRDEVVTADAAADPAITNQSINQSIHL